MRLYYVAVDTLRGVPVHAAPQPIELTAQAPGHYTLKRQGPLPVGTYGYFMLEATDRKNDVQNTFGLWRIAMQV